MCSRKYNVLLLCLALFFAYCSDTDRSNKWDKSNGMFTSYTISGQENNDLVTVFFKFHPGSLDTRAVSLKEPAKIFLDGVLLNADSAKETGAFYEMQMPAGRFTGVHTILYMDENSQEHREEFLFRPFTLNNVIGDSITRNELVLKFEGLQDKALVRVVITDTSFTGEGINELVRVENNQLDLRKFLTAITNGPVQMQLFLEEEKPINKSYGKGIISITYSLKREFELKD